MGTQQTKLLLSEQQKELINKITVKADVVTYGELVWRALLYAKREMITIDYLINYISFITDKQHDNVVYLQNRFTLHSDLKALSQSYKEIGYNIKMKGVVLLYVLYYADKALNVDISQYRVQSHHD